MNEKQEVGIKYDAGKSMAGTILDVFPFTLYALGEVIEFGTHKYPNPNNWKQVKDAKKKYKDALMRHLLKFCIGQDVDSETGKPHLAHVVWNALAICELYLMDVWTKDDERFTK